MVLRFQRVHTLFNVTNVLPLEAVLKARHTVLDTVSPEKSHVIIRRLRVKPAMMALYLSLTIISLIIIFHFSFFRPYGMAF
jgi:hypothetical protein